MESLPLEVVEIIGRHLSAQELATFCATNHKFRNFFNQDLFWKPLCKQWTADYLSKTPCRVQPAFISPEVEGSGLDPVCQWRMNYMRENHLFNNWRSGRYTSVQARDFTDYYKETSHWLLLFYQEEFLIYCNEENNNVSLWDLRCDPEIYVDSPCLLLPLVNEVDGIYLYGNRLVVVQGSAVLVFQINLIKNKWPLEHTFFYDADGPTDFISATTAILLTNSKCNYIFIKMVGNYLLARSSDRSLCFHIWDIVNGVKLKVEAPENTEYCITDIKLSTTSLYDIIINKNWVNDYENTKVLVYSLLSFTYYPCVFEGAEYYNLHRDNIVVYMRRDHHWLIANYKTGEEIHRIKEIGCGLRICPVFDNKLIYSTVGFLNQINLSTGEKKQSPCHSRLDSCSLLGNKFIFMNYKLTETYREEGLNICDLIAPVTPTDPWEICVSNRILLFDSFFGFKTNSTLTKIIVEKESDVYVVSF